MNHPKPRNIITISSEDPDYGNQTNLLQIICAFVTSTLDCGNALLYGLPSSQLHRLQLVQNAAARVVETVKTFDRITHIRKALHWLPIQARIKFKILVLTWKTLHGLAPRYLSELLKEKSNVQRLRSSGKMLLDEQFGTVCQHICIQK